MSESNVEASFYRLVTLKRKRALDLLAYNKSQGNHLPVFPISGVYPGVIMTVLLRRKISYHLLQTYLPSGLFVIVAWLSLFLPPESIPGRITMAMTTLLTLAAMFGAVRSVDRATCFRKLRCTLGLGSVDQDLGCSASRKLLWQPTIRANSTNRGQLNPGRRPPALHKMKIKRPRQSFIKSRDDDQFEAKQN